MSVNEGKVTEKLLFAQGRCEYIEVPLPDWLDSPFLCCLLRWFDSVETGLWE